jgi:predicted peptidase
MRHAPTILVLIICAALQCGEDFEKREFKDFTPPPGVEMKQGVIIRYRLHTPEPLDSTAKYPLILFLHGAGERGTNNSGQLKNGIKHILAYTKANRCPAFIIAPQSPEKWVDTPWEADAHTMPTSASGTMTGVIALVESMRSHPSVDRDRIYVTGISMGGFGTFDIVQRRSDLFAAALPICGGGDIAQAGQLKDLPMWVVHGEKDNIVKVSRSRDMVAAITKAGGKPTYIEIPGGNHFVWDRAYTDAQMMSWMFQQRRGGQTKAGGGVGTAPASPGKPAP